MINGFAQAAGHRRLRPLEEGQARRLLPALGHQRRQRPHAGPDLRLLATARHVPAAMAAQLSPRQSAAGARALRLSPSLSGSHASTRPASCSASGPTTARLTPPLSPLSAFPRLCIPSQPHLSTPHPSPSPMPSKTITARRLITDSAVVEFPVITLAGDGTIAEITSDPKALAHERDTLTAAFLDVHTHGAMGHDVMSASPAQLGEMQRFLAITASRTICRPPRPPPSTLHTARAGGTRKRHRSGATRTRSSPRRDPPRRPVPLARQARRASRSGVAAAKHRTL
jgi:hypothetical protein